MTMLLLHLNYSIVCFHYHLIIITIFIFLDVYNVYKPSNKNFAPVKRRTFR